MGAQALAMTGVSPTLAESISQQLVQPAAGILPWKVNDSCDYSMNGGIIQGTVHMFVASETDQGFWVQQDMDMGFLGKQKVEVLYDKTTAKVLQMKVNDQAQTPPDPNDQKIVETKNDHITVPKGEFDCMYVKIHDNKQNQDAETWVNPKIVPIAGMLKTLSQSQLGPIDIELTNFVKN
jgi:hypothetical protein